MDFKQVLVDLLVAGVFVIRRLLFLILAPYKTMRLIAQEKDFYQIMIIAFLILGYFFWAARIKDFPLPFWLIFLAAVVNWSFLIGFFYGLAKFFDRRLRWESFVFTLSYSLLPTLIWFFGNSIFYAILPPPRTCLLYTSPSPRDS